MEKELEQFRQEVERLRAGRKAGSGPFPEPLRAFAVRYLAYAQEKGDTLKAVVERLGVSEPTLQAWRRGQTPGSKKTRSGEPRATPLLPVVVHPPKPRAGSPVATTLAVVSPQGWSLPSRKKSLRWSLSLWSGLTVFLSNPWVPLDNNLVERQLRDMVVGRKNHYGSKSLRGTEVAALFYSLIETARLRGEDPGRYLLRAALAAIENPGTVTLPASSD